MELTVSQFVPLASCLITGHYCAETLTFSSSQLIRSPPPSKPSLSQHKHSEHAQPRLTRTRFSFLVTFGALRRTQYVTIATSHLPAAAGPAA